MRSDPPKGDSIWEIDLKPSFNYSNAMKLLLDRIHDLYRQLKFNAPAKNDVSQKKLKPIKN